MENNSISNSIKSKTNNLSQYLAIILRINLKTIKKMKQSNSRQKKKYFLTAATSVQISCNFHIRLAAVCKFSEGPKGFFSPSRAFFASSSLKWGPPHYENMKGKGICQEWRIKEACIEEESIGCRFFPLFVYLFDILIAMMMNLTVNTFAFFAP